jgi:Fe-S-cluster containining protein
MSFACRPGCGACCIAPSITTPFPGMPHGKRAGERCVHLDDGNLCRLFGHPDRPPFCGALRPQPSMCGASDAEALTILTQLEAATAPRTVRRSSCGSRD